VERKQIDAVFIDARILKGPPPKPPLWRDLDRTLARTFGRLAPVSIFRRVAADFLLLDSAKLGVG
jgi:hypothetical protein